MAEFLIREINVAIPEVDVGDDILVVRDDNDVISRVQVKTANAKSLANKGISLQPFRARFAPWPPPAEIPEGVIPPQPPGAPPANPG
jgi:hypothetical protein